MLRMGVGLCQCVGWAMLRMGVGLHLGKSSKVK